MTIPYQWLSGVQNPSIIPSNDDWFTGIPPLGYYDPQHIDQYNPRTNHQPTVVVSTNSYPLVN